ncbi:MAG: hypothetical protein ACYTGN_03310 [Planctomycetota bacterium]|jgi:hypothetical protein
MLRSAWRFLRWPLLVLALFVGGWLTWTAAMRSEFETRVEALRAASEPVDPVDLEVGDAPADENAGPALRALSEAIGDLPGFFNTVEDVEILGEDPEDLAAAKTRMGEWLDEHRAVITQLHAVAARPRCEYGLDYSQGHALEVRAIPDAQRVARVLEQHTRREAGAGRSDEALRSIETLLRVGDHLPRPFAICYLVRITVHGVALRLLEELSAQRGFDAAQARGRLEGLLTAAEDAEAPPDAMRGERVMALLVGRRWIAGESPLQMLSDLSSVEYQPVDDWLYGTWVFRPFAIRDGLQVLDDMQRSIVALRAEDWADLDRLADEVAERTLPYLFSKLYGVLPAKVGEERRAHLARLRVARTGLALLAAGRTPGSSIPTPPSRCWSRTGASRPPAPCPSGCRRRAGSASEPNTKSHGCFLDEAGGASSAGR